MAWTFLSYGLHCLVAGVQERVIDMLGSWRKFGETQGQVCKFGRLGGVSGTGKTPLQFPGGSAVGSVLQGPRNQGTPVTILYLRVSGQK